MRIGQVPERFMPTDHITYPPHNDTTIEEEMYARLKDRDIKTDRTYYPIFWTTYYCRSNYAQDQRAVQAINDFCKEIKEPWFTISQYDDGVLMGVEQRGPDNFSLSFSAGGKGDIPIPLTSKPWPNTENRPEPEFIASFIGNKNTHPIRSKMFEVLEDEPGFYLEQVTRHKDHYKDVMLKSKYALCPRGYGKTSFRLYEAMQMGTIPIYISDEHWLPYDKNIIDMNSMIIVREDEIEKIPYIIQQRDSTVLFQSYFQKELWNAHYSFDACANNIQKILESGK